MKLVETDAISYDRLVSQEPPQIMQNVLLSAA